MSQVSIPDDVLERVDRIAEETDLKRHEIVRFAVERLTDEYAPTITVDPYKVAFLRKAVVK